MLANYHTHTTRCGHARGSDREYVEAAIERGIKLLGFADHVPTLPYEPEFPQFRMPMEQAEEYVSSLTKLKEEYKNDIEIHIGFECEYMPIHYDLMRRLNDIGTEYVLLSQHFLMKDGYPGYGGSTNPDDLKSYVDLVIAGAATGSFTYICHPDIYKFIGDGDYWKYEYRRLCVAAKKLGVPLEFNLQGFVEHRHHPTEKFLEIAKEVGNEFIIGFDAHYPEMFLNREFYDSCVAELDKFGLKRIETVELKSLV